MKKHWRIFTICLLTVLTLVSRPGYGQNDDTLFWFTGQEVKKLYVTVIERDQALERIASIEALISFQDSAFYFCEQGNMELIGMINILHQQKGSFDQEKNILNQMINANAREIKRQKRHKWFFVGTTALAITLGLLGGG